jgi:TonB family protein
VNRVNQRQGFLVSAIVHVTMLMILISREPKPRKAEDIDTSELERKSVVFLPPPAVLRQALPPALRPTPAPAAPRPQTPATPPPPDATKKDRISVGPPSDLRAKGPMILRKDDDLTKVPKGQPSPPSTPPPAAPTPAPSATPGAPTVADGGGATPAPGREGLRLPPGIGSLPRGDEGTKGRPGPLGPSIARAERELEQRLARDQQLGIPSGTGQNLGGLYFDPQGADFTLWVSRFKNEVYRNWIVPQPALMGFRGHVEFEFSVERDGTMSSLHMLRSSGTPAMDRAAQNALVGSRFLPLPADYGPPRITMRVTFYYNEGPAES